jgi:ABC-type phosphate/phosphonate transport system substrate-binding protein
MRWLRRLGWSCLLTAALVAQAADLPAQPPLLKLGFYLPSIREANQVDIKVSLQVWAEEMGVSLGYQVVTSTYQNMTEMRSAVERGELHFVNAGGMELAETFAPGELQTGYARHHQGLDDGLALVVRSESGIASFTDLRGKRVSRLSNDRLADIFLETQCLKSAKQRCSQFLNQVEERRDIQSIYSVFFGKADGALVALSTLRTATELNPQVANRLKVIQDWKTLSLFFGMLTKRASPADLNTMMGSAREAMKSSRGKQMMELFKTDSVEPVDSSTLNVYWTLLQEYKALDKAYGVKKK